MKKIFLTLFLIICISLLMACSQNSNSEGFVPPENLTLDVIKENAISEGEIVSVGMPDNWVNWEEIWAALKDEYGLNHSDTDLSSAEEIAKFEAERENATADIGDIGWDFGPIAVEKELTMPYKTSYWDSVPEWAKDEDGHLMMSHMGTLAFITNKELVDEIPTSFEDLLNGDYIVAIGDVNAGAQSQMSVLAAAIAFGGDEANIEPGLDFFATLAKENRLATNNTYLTNIENGEVEVAIVWDFTALVYKYQIDAERFDVRIPSDATVTSGYTQIINKYANNPYAAMLTREYIFSDAGQIALAKGYAKPIREDVVLPQEVKELLLPDEQYNNVYRIENTQVWGETVSNLPGMWQEKVLVHIN